MKGLFLIFLLFQADLCFSKTISPSIIQPDDLVGLMHDYLKKDLKNTKMTKNMSLNLLKIPKGNVMDWFIYGF
jgi:hypothetical protein